MKKLLIFVLPLLVTACFSGQNNPVTSVKASTGAKLTVKLGFKSFSGKAASPGEPAKTVNDINAVKFYLTTSNGSNPLLAANVKFSSGLLVYPAGSTSKTYTFFNVSEGTYYVAAELFSDTTGSTNIIEPVTFTSASSGDTAFGFPGGKRGLTLSTNSATVISPAMTFTFSDSTNAFNVSPLLLNAKGADFGASVTTQPGNANVTGPVQIQ
jgi:hypothetical protein